MARLPRLCIPGWPHALVQRGHNRQPVFIDDDDRNLFRQLLAEGAVQHGAQIHAYSLLEDEFRLLATPAAPDTLSQLMQSIGRRYVARFNRRHARSGSLWEGRFRATVLEPEQHLLPCMLFAEGATDGSVSLLTVSPWSSAAHHLGSRVDPLITEPRQFWLLGNTPFEREAAYRQRMAQGLTEKELQAILHAVSSGWPLGEASFVSSLSTKTDRRLTARQPGRPRIHVRGSDPN